MHPYHSSPYWSDPENRASRARALIEANEIALALEILRPPEPPYMWGREIAEMIDEVHYQAK